MPVFVSGFGEVLETLEEFSAAFGVLIDASYDEIERACDEIIEENRRTGGINRYRHKSGRLGSYISPHNPRNDDNYFMNIYRILKTKKACDSCKKFSFPENMSQVNGYFFCNNQECSQLYQIRTSAIQTITNQLQQTRVSFQNLYETGRLAFIGLFEIDNCRCEHPGMTLQDYTNHIQNCLKTRTEIENFKNEMLRIIERAVQNRPVNSVQANTSQSLNSNPYPTPPPSPNFTATSSNSSSLTNENGSNNFSTATPSWSTSSISSPSSTASSSSSSISQNQTSPKPSSPVLDITTSQPTSSEKLNNNSLVDLPTNNSKPNHEFSSEPLPPKNNNSEAVLDYPNNHNNENDKSALPANENLTTQKQQIIQQIQTELVKSPNLDLDQFSNWKQTIEKMSSIQQLQVYQNSLQQYLQSKKNSLTSSSQSQLTPSKTETNHSKFIWLVLGSILAVGVLVWFWIKKKESLRKRPNINKKLRRE